MTKRQIKLIETLEGVDFEHGMFVDMYNRKVKKDIACTILASIDIKREHFVIVKVDDTIKADCKPVKK